MTSDWPKHHAETVEVVAAAGGVHHLHRAAGQPEGHGPERAGLGPARQLVEMSDQEALVLQLLGRTGQNRVLIRTRREGLFHIAASYSHSNAPFRHS
jgi:hypothetical protein